MRINFDCIIRVLLLEYLNNITHYRPDIYCPLVCIAIITLYKIRKHSARLDNICLMLMLVNNYSTITQQCASLSPRRNNNI